MGTEPAASPLATPRPPAKIRARAWSLEEAVDGAFFALAGVLVVWLGALLVTQDLAWSWRSAGSVVVFWALVAYVGLPRLQQVMAKIYVPDYFVGRTVTDSGILGDPVNLALDGTAGQLHGAMQRAGWTLADEVTLRSSWGIVVSALLRRSYPGAPVSPLFLFGARHAFAYEQEVDGNASQRHHVRFWPTPAGWHLPGGRVVGWLAAGTYDRKVGLSLFTLQVTHKVDADIDAERDHVVASVRAADPAARVTVLEHLFMAFHTRNGGGDLVHTDGSLPVLDLSAVAPAAGPGADDDGDAAAVAPADPTRRRLPPTMLAIAGLVSAGKALGTLVSLLLVAAGSARADLFPGATGAQLAGSGAAAAAIAGLWILVLARRRWARTLLLAVCAVEAAGQLAAIGARHGDGGFLVLLAAGLSVLVLITVSSDEARRWVEPGGPR